MAAIDRAVSEERARAYSEPFAEVLRGKIALLAADGQLNTLIAEPLDVHVGVFIRWRKRFAQFGLDWVGRPAPVGAEVVPTPVVAEVKAMACEPPEQRDVPLPRWSSAELAAQAVAGGLMESVSASTIRLWVREDANQAVAAPVVDLSPRPGLCA